MATTTISTEREALAAWSTLADPTDTATRDLVTQRGVIEAVHEMIRSRIATYSLYPIPTLEDMAREHPDMRLIIPGDDEWPDAVDTMALPPLALWVKGPADVGAALASSLAVTGARASTAYGEYVAAEMSGAITAAGPTVVTGGAFGIDAAATRGALAVGGAPIVMQAGGIARAYPSAHTALFEKVVSDGGAIISEVAPDRQPTRSRFLRRYAVMGAITSGTLVVEAGMRSGALMTAQAAIDAFRPLGAVPGPVTSMLSAGPHDLLARRQAYLVTTGQEAAALIQ